MPCNLAISIKIRGCTSTTKPTRPAPKNGPPPSIAPPSIASVSVSAARRSPARHGDKAASSGPRGWHPARVCMSLASSLGGLLAAHADLPACVAPNLARTRPTLALTCHPVMFSVDHVMLRPPQSCSQSPQSTRTHRSNTDTTGRICFTTRPNCCQSLPAAARPAQVAAGQYSQCSGAHASFPSQPARAMLSICLQIQTLGHCDTCAACSVFVSRRILDIMYYVFISDPGNFHVCMWVDAIPVLRPCGDKLKKGRRGAKGTRRGPGDTMGALSYRGDFNKPESGQAQALEFCLTGQVDLHRQLQNSASFSRPRSSSRSGERILLFFFQ